MKAALVVLDGAGLASPGPANAVTAHTMPVLFGLMAGHGHAVLEASGPAVGLMEGQSGNSEAGHLTIGAGHVVPSPLCRLRAAYDNGSWRAHPLWAEMARHGRLHVVGLLSDAGVHGHWRTLEQCARLAVAGGAAEVVVHPVLDGVDSPVGGAPALLAALEGALADIGKARLGVVMGRRSFCDRSGDPARSEPFAAALGGRVPLAPFTPDALAAAANEADFPAALYPGGVAAAPGEAVLVASHRADRACQAARALGAGHPVSGNPVYGVVPLPGAVPETRAFFPTEPLDRGIGTVLGDAGIAVTRIAEDCKFPHVTRFFDGFRADDCGAAVRVPGLAEETLADHPGMAAARVADAVIERMGEDGPGLVVANLANLDQIGHLGRIGLAHRAAAVIDGQLERIRAAARRRGWALIVTADHGNAERMTDNAGRPFGSHTCNPVPFVAVPAEGDDLRLTRRHGSLANVAASTLTALGLAAPAWMASSLIERQQ